MKTGKFGAGPAGPHPRNIAIGHESISTPTSRRGRLMAGSALAGGALRYLAVAAGMATVLGASPALAQFGCQSAANDLSAGGNCTATAATGANPPRSGTSRTRPVSPPPRTAT